MITNEELCKQIELLADIDVADYTERAVHRVVMAREEEPVKLEWTNPRGEFWEVVIDGVRVAAYQATVWCRWWIADSEAWVRTANDVMLTGRCDDLVEAKFGAAKAIAVLRRFREEDA